MIYIICVLFLFSCKKDAIELPKSNKTILGDIENHSDINFFFNLNKKDTILSFNNHNTIKPINLVCTIDKRLSLRLVMPEVINLLEKKKNHTGKKTESIYVYSYADSITNKLSFYPFSSIRYKFDAEFSKFYIIEHSNLYMNFQNFSINFNKKNQITVDGNYIDRAELIDFLKDFIPFVSQEKTALLHLNFEKSLSFEQYIQNKIFLHEILSDKVVFSPVEFIYDAKKLPDCGCKL
ncbi:hypothetical protein [uncultured Flavobacterium sp.]|uniref:hypothetical protein n=1 Tax=uncultured Flavobacterium sp. TaxID=165435 RepID=UPI0030CA3A9A